MNNYTYIILSKMMLQIVIMSSMVSVSNAMEVIRDKGNDKLFTEEEQRAERPLNSNLERVESTGNETVFSSTAGFHLLNLPQVKEGVGNRLIAGVPWNPRRVDGSPCADPGCQMPACEVDEQGMTALHRAAREGEEDTVYSLLKAGTIDMSCRDNFGRVALHYAAARGNRNIVYMLMGHDYGIVYTMTKDHEGKLPLHYACECGHELTVKDILDSNVDTIEREDDVKRIVIFLVRNDEFTKVKNRVYVTLEQLDTEEIGEAGQDEQEETQDGRSKKFSKETLRLLIDNKLGKIERSTKEDADKAEELLTFVFEDNLVNPRYLLKLIGFSDTNCFDEQRNTPLHLATWGNYVSVMKLLRGSNVDAVNVEGWTPLHVAYAMGHFAAARYLIEEKFADCNVPDNVGRTPVHLVAEGGQEGHHVVLLHLKEQVVATRPKDETVLEHKGKGGLRNFFSKEEGQKQLDQGESTLDDSILPDDYELLLQEDSGTSLVTVQESGNKTPAYLTNFNAEDDNQKTPLHRALEEGNLHVAKSLISCEGVLVDVNDNNRTTPLHLACVKRLTDIVGLLINRGANPNIQDATGQTALHKAVLSELMHGDDRVGIVLLLCQVHQVDAKKKKSSWQKHSADVKLQDSLGRTALHYAAKLGLSDILPVLLRRRVLREKLLNTTDNEGKTAFQLAQIEKENLENRATDERTAMLEYAQMVKKIIGKEAIEEQVAGEESMCCESVQTVTQAIEELVDEIEILTIKSWATKELLSKMQVFENLAFEKLMEETDKLFAEEKVAGIDKLAIGELTGGFKNSEFGIDELIDGIKKEEVDIDKLVDQICTLIDDLCRPAIDNLVEKIGELAEEQQGDDTREQATLDFIEKLVVGVVKQAIRKLVNGIERLGIDKQLAEVQQRGSEEQSITEQVEELQKLQKLTERKTATKEQVGELEKLVIGKLASKIPAMVEQAVSQLAIRKQALVVDVVEKQVDELRKKAAEKRALEKLAFKKQVDEVRNQLDETEEQAIEKLKAEMAELSFEKQYHEGMKSNSEKRLADLEGRIIKKGVQPLKDEVLRMLAIGNLNIEKLAEEVENLANRIEQMTLRKDARKEQAIEKLTSRKLAGEIEKLILKKLEIEQMVDEREQRSFGHQIANGIEELASKVDRQAATAIEKLAIEKLKAYKEEVPLLLAKIKRLTEVVECLNKKQDNHKD